MIILKEIQKHYLNYLILGIMLVTSGILFFYFRQNFDVYDQRLVVYGTSVLYFIWSLYHHYHRGDLHLSIVIEYFLLALFAVIIAATTLI